jgi:phage terminase small subunit
MESFDRMRAAQASIEQDGATAPDRFGQVKAHPLLSVERDARAAMLAALKAMNLDVEPLRDGPGRPADREGSSV